MNRIVYERLVSNIVDDYNDDDRLGRRRLVEADQYGRTVRPMGTNIGDGQTGQLTLCQCGEITTSWDGWMDHDWTTGVEGLSPARARTEVTKLNY